MLEEEKEIIIKEIDEEQLDKHLSQRDIAEEKEKHEFEPNIKDIDPRLLKSKVKYKQELVDENVILSVRHLKQFFTFGGGMHKAKLKAVNNVSFDVKKGECVGLVGESGCGKTTTGRSIIKLYNITSGSIYYKGYRISAGIRWNQKEIKYTKIRFNAFKKENEINRKKELDDAILNNANADDLKAINDKYDLLLGEMKSKADEIIRVQKGKIKQAKYDNKHVNRRLVNEIQMIFQDPVDSLDPRMTVEDIIAEGLIIQEPAIKKQEALKEKIAFRRKEEELKERLHSDDAEIAKQAKTELEEFKASYREELKKNKKTKSELVAEALDKVGLIPEYASRYPHEFSGGQRQRIGIARALIMNPQLLICDEPISALDVSIRAQIINLLNDLKEEYNLSIIFIAHDLSVVKYFCDRICVMYFGKIVEEASSDELFKHPLHPYTKALLSAIPRPDPRFEKNRQRIIYNPQTAHDYSKQAPSFREIAPGHKILCNDEEFEKYLKEYSATEELIKEENEKADSPKKAPRKRKNIKKDAD